MTYKDILNATPKWLIQGAPCTPHANWFAAMPLTSGLEKVHPGLGMRILLTFFQNKGELGNWVHDEEFLYAKGKYLEEHPKIIDRLFKLWETKVSLFLKEVQKLEKKGITNIISQYEAFSSAYCEEYEVALMTEYFTVWSDVIIERIAQNVPKEHQKELQELVLPFRRSFLSEEELSALKIGRQLLSINYPSLAQIKERNPSLHQQIVEHQQKFYWLTTGYKYAEPVSEEQFFSTILEATKTLSSEEIKKKISFLENYEQELQKKKQKILAKIKLSEYDLSILETISTIAWMHDTRKRCNLMGSYWINQFLLKVSQEKNISHELLQFTLPREFIAYLKTGKIDLPLLKERMKGCMAINTSVGDDVLIHGKEFQALKRRILDAEVGKEITDFRGTAASYGKVQGKVKVITNPAKQTLQQGEILVAPMTRPEYVPLMKKAAAIITDEGGITSHAAIISRELGIPCIVGTRIATKVLKDGMMVDVNANHALVKILK